jgi:hypothetical protein
MNKNTDNQNDNIHESIKLQIKQHIKYKINSVIDEQKSYLTVFDAFFDYRDTSLYKIVEVAIYKFLTKKLNDFLDKIDPSEFLKISEINRCWCRGNFSDIIQNKEKTKESKLLILKTAHKLLELHYVPKFECMVFEKSYYGIDSGWLDSNIREKLLPKIEENLTSTSFKEFLEMFKENKVVSFCIDLLEEREKFFEREKNEIVKSIMEKLSQNKYDSPKIKIITKQRFVDMIGLDLEGRIRYCIECSNEDLHDRWLLLKMVFGNNVKYVQSSTKPIENLPPFVENWVFNIEG